MNTTMQYTLDFMEEIINIPSPAGYTYECIDKIDEEFKNLGYSVKRTPKNALVVTVEGADIEKQKLIVGHVDTLGGMVKEIKPNGRLLLAQLGGFSWNSVEGENVYVITDSNKRYTGTILPTKASIHVHSDIVNFIRLSYSNSVGSRFIIFDKATARLMFFSSSSLVVISTTLSAMLIVFSMLIILTIIKTYILQLLDIIIITTSPM